MNDWYSGNIVFAGLIGMLAVDSNTGAMFTLKPKQVDATLSSLKVPRNADAHTLTVMLLANVPRKVSDQLVPASDN